jgi:hypothetical protein
MTTLRAHVHNGQIILDDSVQLPEGAAVTVQVELNDTVATEAATPLDGVRQYIGAFGELPSDASTSYKQVLRQETERR